MKQTKMAEELMFLLLPLHSPILWKCSICFFIFLSLETIPQWIVAPTYETLACALPTNVSCKNEVFFFSKPCSSISANSIYSHKSPLHLRFQIVSLRICWDEKLAHQSTIHSGCSLGLLHRPCLCDALCSEGSWIGTSVPELCLGKEAF